MNATCDWWFSIAKKYTNRGLQSGFDSGKATSFDEGRRQVRNGAADISFPRMRRGGFARRLPRHADQARTIRIPVHMIETINKLGADQPATGAGNLAANRTSERSPSA